MTKSPAWTNGPARGCIFQTNADTVLLVGGSQPFVTTLVLELPHRAGTPHYGAAAFRLGGRKEPLRALYRHAIVSV